MGDKVHKSYRLEKRTVDLIEMYAEQHGVTQTQAVIDMVDYASKEQVSTQANDTLNNELVAHLKESLASARAQIETLTNQLDIKDSQIDGYKADLAQAMQLSQAITELSTVTTKLNVLNEHKALQAANSAREQQANDIVVSTSVDDTDQDKPRKQGLFSSLFNRNR